MNWESLNIGGCPFDEPCISTNPKRDYVEAQKAQCRAFILGLRKMFGGEPEGAKLYIKANPHDFGTYYEVECRFDPANAKAVDYAYACEQGFENWSDVGMVCEVDESGDVARFTIISAESE